MKMALYGHKPEADVLSSLSSGFVILLPRSTAVYNRLYTIYNYIISV